MVGIPNAKACGKHVLTDYVELQGEWVDKIVDGRY